MAIDRIRTTLLALFLVSFFFSFFSFSQHISAQNQIKAYEITMNTLQHLRHEQLPLRLLQEMRSLIGNRFTDKKKFEQRLQQLAIPFSSKQYLPLILQYAVMSQLRIQAERFQGAQTKGELIFSGNVKGAVPRENVNFQMEQLTLVSLEGRYEKMFGEGKVELEQWNRNLKTGQIRYVNINPLTNQLQLIEQSLQFRHGLDIKAKQGMVQGDSADVDWHAEASILRGIAGKEQAYVQLNLDEVERQRLWNALEKLPAPSPTPEIIELRAYQMILDQKKNAILLEGNVELERQYESVYLRAERITIQLDENQQIISVQAEQNVCLQQPGRVSKANFSYFSETEQILQLLGGAEAHTGQYSMKGEEINLYLDVSKGAARGNDKTPIEVIVSMGDSTNELPFQCR